MRYAITEVKRNEAAIEEAKDRQGWRVQVTNLPVSRWNLREGVLLYNGGWSVERDFHLLKDRPLGIQPLFVREEEQIVGLTRLLTIALRVLTLSELQVRSGLSETEEALSGLYEGQPNRSTAYPTAGRCLKAISRMEITATRVESGRAVAPHRFAALAEAHHETAAFITHTVYPSDQSGSLTTRLRCSPATRENYFCFSSKPLRKRRVMRREIKQIVLQLRIPQMVARIRPPRAVLLLYHSIQRVPADYANIIGAGIIHSEALFAEQMEFVSRRFNVVTISDILMWLHGTRPLPRRAVAITFDDGFADNYTTAAPILARYGLRAAFYVSCRPIGTRRWLWFCRLRFAFLTTVKRQWTDPASGETIDVQDPRGRLSGFRAACRSCAVLTGDRQDQFVACVDRQLGVTSPHDAHPLMMDWDQVAALQNSGHIIGSHTMTHPNMAHCGCNEAADELAQSKGLLEQQLGYEVQHFSYPSPFLQPHCSERTGVLVSKAGYVSAVTSLPGPVRRSHNACAIPRVSAPNSMSELQWVLETSLAGRIS